MNIEQLYIDYSIPIAPMEHKHAHEGWVHVECPFCEGNVGYHLGFNIQDEYFMCWRCGWKAIEPAVAKLLNVSYTEAKKILLQYKFISKYTTRKAVVEINQKDHQFPSNTMPFNQNHTRYLESRNFDPERLERMWNLIGTGPISLLDGLNYRHRILIPFIWNGQQVSFDSRDITGKHQAKYMACPKNRELIPHKSILYGKQEKWKDTGICVEGPTDVWRFGECSFAVSGIKYTTKQVREIAKAFKRVAVCFDGGESVARKQANALVADLNFRGVEAWRVDIVGDPGSMGQSEANYLVKQLIK